MFKLKRAQLEAFAQDALIDFHERVRESVRESFPLHAEMLGDRGIDAMLDRALACAASHGIRHARGVEQVLYLMLLLGSGFDEDPQLPWATAILADHSEPPGVRADRLYAEALAFLDRVAGPRGEHIIRALRRAADARYELIPASPAAGREDATAARLTELFPQKCEELGVMGVRRLVGDAATRAAHQGVVGERGVTLVATMMLLLGSGFDADPQLPWVTEILRDAPGNEAAAVERLLAAARAHLSRWMIHFPEES